MSIDVNNLPDDPVLLKQLLIKQVQRNRYLEEQFRLAQQKQFGKSSEDFPGQGELLNEAEEIADIAQEDKQDINYTRNKPKRKPLSKDLPREQIIHDIPEEEKHCDCCQSELHKIGEDTSEKLEFIPAQVKVIEHIRPKYACRQCEKTSTTNYIKQAKVPASPIPKGIATASLSPKNISMACHCTGKSRYLSNTALR